MGVPKFYRWLSERFPCLSEVVKEHQIPEFDHLYLDMNGIIHNCSHPNDDDPHFRITEEKIFQDIFHYIEVLFRMIQPKKVFFMAIDGVAPRAKMNQQRGRRFRSAKDAELNEKKAKDRGEELPKEARFDSNCITPGTPFMCRLHKQLQYFVTSKISTDSLWQGVTVILSGHETPGEGEHKIMDFIRHQKSQPGYDPNLRHCLYGLDADLVMLGMCTHDPHFSLLREEVKFGGKKTQQKRTVTPEETTFHLLHLSLLREYLDHEFGKELRPKLQEESCGFEYDLERIIDDWILLGFLVGNDFIPNLPHLHINKGALTELYTTYKKVLPSLGGYMNDGGTLNLKRFEKFMGALAENEMDRFDDIYSDSKWLEGKTASKQKGKGGKSRHTVKPTPGPAHVEGILMSDSDNMFGTLTQGDDGDDDGMESLDPELQRFIKSTDGEIFGVEGVGGGSDAAALLDQDLRDAGMDGCDEDDDLDGRGKAYHMEFRQHKREYYITKMKYGKVTADELREQAEGYVRAIQWNLHYYYNGCMSWSWFFPHHFAPYITDIKDFSGMELTFEMSEPFLPYEQLLSVLPAASKALLPPTLQGLMEEDWSPILDYYPPEFDCDLNGKQQEWEAVVLIPFIDEKRLLDAVRPRYPHMTPDEKARNAHGPMCVFNYSKSPLGAYQAPDYFPPVGINHALQTKTWRSEWDVPIENLRKGLMKGVRLDVFFPGFPTLHHIPHTARFKESGVKVFEQTSRGVNAMLVLEDQGRPDIEEVANQLLGQEIWVNWPHMIEAKVSAVSDARTKLSLNPNFGNQVQREESDKQEFNMQVKAVADRYKTRWGVLVGDTHIIVHASAMTGRKYICGNKGRITLEKQWSRLSQPYALQTTRKDILVHDPSFTQYRTLPELYPNDSVCFLVGANVAQYGCQGTVVQINPEHKGRIQLTVIEPREPDLFEVKKAQKSLGAVYFPGFKAAQRLGITSHLLSRITGSIFISKGAKEAEADYASKINVGLNLKFNKKNEEVCGYTKKTEESGWSYSSKTILLISQYIQRYPQLFDYLSGGNNVQNDFFHHSEVWPEGNGEEMLTELAAWLKELPSASAERQPCGTQALDVEIVKVIEDTIAEQKTDRKKQLTMQVRPHLLFKPNLSQGSSLPDPETTFHLFDRVVNVRDGFSVPLGLRGTVIGIQNNSSDQSEVFVEVVFDSEFSGGLKIRSSSPRCYRMPGAALINLSHGQRGGGRANAAAAAFGGGQQQAKGEANKNRKQQQQQKPTAVVNPMGENVTPVPNFWANRQQQQQQQPLSKPHHKKGGPGGGPRVARQQSKEDSPLASAAQKIGVPATHGGAQPPDPKNLPMPSFASKPGKKNPSAGTNQANFEKVWSKMQQPQEPSKQEPEDLSDFLSSLQLVGKSKDQSQNQQAAKKTQSKPQQAKGGQQSKQKAPVEGGHKPLKVTKAVKGTESPVEIAPAVLDFFAQAAGGGTNEQKKQPDNIPETSVNTGPAVAATNFVPLQVMKSANKAKDQSKTKSQPTPCVEQPSGSRVEAWVSQTLTQTPSTEPSTTGQPAQQQKKSTKKANKKPSKNRLAANFGGQ